MLPRLTEVRRRYGDDVTALRHPLAGGIRDVPLSLQMQKHEARYSWRIPAPLSTYDWVRLREPYLRSRGHDPAARVCYTGHTTSMRTQWLDSIGRWSSCETAEMISKTEPCCT